MVTFAEKFCRDHALAPEKFEAELLRRTLYPTARWLRPLLALNRRYFDADRDFVRSIGRIRRMSDFGLEAMDYVDHPENRGLLRDGLRLRVSVRRMQAIVQRTLHPVAGHGRVGERVSS